MVSPPIPAFHEHDHDACRNDVLSQADALTRASGARLTPVRRRVLEILLEGHRAMGAYEVLDRLAAEGMGKQPPVAYRALDFLVEQGLVHRIHRLNAYLACHIPGKTHLPAFLICRLCDCVAESQAPALWDNLDILARKSGFDLERAAIEAVGLCPNCAAEAQG